MTGVSQDEVVHALGEPGIYPGHPETVEHLQTHISHVFLAGPYAYKLKKAVHFAFLDFSTVERRRHFCAEEIRLNRRLCPSVFVECRADERVIRARLAARDLAPSLSDARWETYLGQRAEQEALSDAEPHVGVDTSPGLPAARASALRALWRWRRSRAA